MAESVSPPPGLFVRQASGLVRDVSMTKALFFNIAASAGNIIGWAVVFYALFPEWQGLGLSAFAWMAILTGIASYFLVLIFVNLTAAMPRSGGDYVFTSRIIGPFWGWLESWTMVGLVAGAFGFEIIAATHNLQLTAILLGVAFPGSVFGHAQGWFQDTTGKVITGVIILLVLAVISLLRTRTFHRVVTGLCIFAVISAVISFIGAFTIDPASMKTALPALGTSSKAITDAAVKAGWRFGTPDFTLPGLIALAGLASIQLIRSTGFQFSAYIAGELKGNVRRSVLFAVLGTLIFTVFMSSIYTDVLGSHYGFSLSNAWGYLYWYTSNAPLHGQPPYIPVMAAAVHPGAWPLWLMVSLGTLTLNVLLAPMWVIVISRIVLAWSLDRQVPAWFSAVNERTNSPLRAIILMLLLGAAFYVMTFFGLNLAGTLFFLVALAILTWIMPGLNAVLIPYRRPDLFRLTKNTGKFLGLPHLVWYGILWLLFIIPLYLATFVWPIIQAIQTAKGANEFVSFSNTSGISAALGLAIVGVLIYFAMKAVNNRRGINTKMIFQELPPD